MVCNWLDIKRKITMWVSLFDSFLCNLGIDECMSQSDYLWIIHTSYLTIRAAPLYLSFVYQFVTLLY